MEYVKVPKDEYERLKSNIVELDATKIGKAIITLYNDYEKLNKQKQDLIVWLEEIRNKPVALFPETQEQAEEVGKVKFCIELLERLVGE